MSLATREQKAVVTDFCVCRALWFFHAMKERIKIRLNKEKLTGHRGVYSNTISSIEYYTSITGANHLLGRTHKTSSVLWLRHNPAPPNEEQFNAPTTGARAMNPNAAVLTITGNLSMLFIRVSPYTLQVSR